MVDHQSQQIRCVVIRGGTSRGVIVERDALPQDAAIRERVVARMFGAGSSGQIDGIGGGLPNTSKVAVVGRSPAEDADIDYLFGQVGIHEMSVDFSGTCGNMASAVGLYAFEEGYTAARPVPTHVRIRDVGTGQILACDILDVPAAEYADGALPGTGTSVALDLAGMQGATTGSVLPTGMANQPLTLPDGRVIPASIIDVGNVMAFIPASALGLTGHESPEDIENSTAMKDLEDLRAATAVALGWCSTPAEWLTSTSRLPFVATVAAPQNAGTDVAVRLYAVGRVHRSIAVTAVASTGAALAINGTTVSDTAGVELDPTVEHKLRIAHPGGTAVISVLGGDKAAAALRYPRTARRVMVGSIFVPADDGPFLG